MVGHKALIDRYSRIPAIAYRRSSSLILASLGRKREFFQGGEDRAGIGVLKLLGERDSGI